MKNDNVIINKSYSFRTKTLANEQSRIVVYLCYDEESKQEFVIIEKRTLSKRHYENNLILRVFRNQIYQSETFYLKPKTIMTISYILAKNLFK